MAISTVDKIPLTLLVDDSCPLVHVFRNHWVDVHKHAPETDDGRPLVETIPNSFLDRFCEVVERHGIQGKFSVVPAPANQGNIVQGIDGFDPSLTHEWVATARRRLSPYFDFSPEGLTHNLVMDLSTAQSLDEGEAIWAVNQDRTTLTPYLIRQLELMRDAGLEASGITSCWTFGQKVEAEYIAAMVAAQKQVSGREFSWFFTHIWHRYPGSRPYVAYAQGQTVLVSINSTVNDHFWETINTPNTDRAYIESVVDQMVSSDGKEGSILRVAQSGGWPIIMTHWQALYSNGTEAGLVALDLLGERVSQMLSEKIAWASCSELARRTVAGLRLPALQTSRID